MKYISLFAGIGGFDLALSKLGHTCVYANDFDKFCKIIYDKHFTPKLDTRNITAVSADEIPDHDLLVGGFPCQAFSIAGQRKGFADKRGTLFFEIARILSHKRPAFLLLENVRGLLHHDNGRTFQEILRTLAELGYELQWQVLNSKHFGVPQNRERVFIIGNLRGPSRPQVFPFEGDGAKDTRTIGSSISPCLDANYAKGFSPNGHQSKQRLAIVVPALRASDYKRGDTQTVIAMPVLTPARVTKRQNGRRFKTNNEPSFTLTGQDIHGIYDGVKVRRLTPIECERLQGFPDNWTQGVSDTQRYKQLGNAVTVNVVYEIAKRLTV